MSAKYKDLRDEISARVKRFGDNMRPIYNLCNTYTSEYCNPFMASANEYRFNYHNQNAYNAVYDSFVTFGKGTAQLLNRVLSVYNTEQQDAVYEAKRNLFVLVESAIQVLQAVLELGYAVSQEIGLKTFGGDIQDTCAGNGITDNQCRRSKLMAKNIYVSEAKHNVLSNRMQQKKCRLVPYAETGYLEELNEFCIRNSNNSVTSNYCSLVSEFIKAKEFVMGKQNEQMLQAADIDHLLATWRVFREELLKIVLQNYLILSNSVKVSCLEKFIEEQHDLMLMMIEKRNAIQTKVEEGVLEDLQI